MNVFNSHGGNISALFKIKKQLLGKDLKLPSRYTVDSLCFHNTLIFIKSPPISKVFIF